MFEYINIFLKSMFIDNMVFAYFLGMCSYLAVSKKVSTAIGLGVAVTFVQVITVPLNYLIYKYVLEAGALSWLDPSLAEIDLSFLNLIIYIAVVATLVQLVEMIIEKFSPALYNSLGIFLTGLMAIGFMSFGGIDLNALNAKPQAEVVTPAPVVEETSVVDSLQIANDSISVDSIQVVE